jgi:hypothetical protein
VKSKPGPVQDSLLPLAEKFRDALNESYC